MNSEDTAHRSMTSYLREVMDMDEATAQLQFSAAPGRSIHPEPQSHLDFALKVRPHYNSIQSFPEEDYAASSNSPTMLLNALRYPESSQRTNRHPSRDRTHDYSSMVGDDSGSGDDSNASVSSQVAFHRYPSAPEANVYPSDTNTPLSANSSPLSVEGVATGVSSLMDYGNALRDYHSQKLQRPQRFREVAQSGQRLPSSYSQIQSTKYTTVTRAADAPGVTPTSPTQMRQDQLPFSSSDSIYNDLNGLGDNNPSHPNDPRNLITASMREPPHTDASPSIPMCNPSALLPPQDLYSHNIKSSTHTHSLRPSNLSSHNQVQQNVIQPGGTLYPDFHSSNVLKEIAAASTLPSVLLQSDPVQQSNSHRPRFSPNSCNKSQLFSSQSVPIPVIGVQGQLHTVDDQLRTASESTQNENMARSGDPTSLLLELTTESPPQANGSLSIGLEEQDEQVDDIDGEPRSSRNAVDSRTSAATRKKKKPKMHECPICNKQFPRPSGLKTHMNIHSNERPFACEFPGCSRTFGVRSNARRHLRTHGVIPAPSQAAGEARYVVDFSTPVIMPPPEQMTSGTSPDLLQQVPADAGEREGSGGSSGRRERRSSSSRVPAYKVRWMQPSSTQHTNGTEPPDVHDGRMMLAGGGTRSSVSRRTSGIVRRPELASSGSSGSDVTGRGDLGSRSSFTVPPTSSTYSASILSLSPMTLSIPSTDRIGRGTSRAAVRPQRGGFHTDTDSLG